VAAPLDSGPAWQPAHGKGQREVQQYDTENMARWWKRVRHDGRLRRRTGVVVLTRGTATEKSGCGGARLRLGSTTYTQGEAA
jgi:hypothetical protein